MSVKVEKGNEFEKNSLLLFSLMMGANIFNYLFQIVLGHLLSVGDYGILNTLMSMVTIMSIPNLLLVMVMAKYTATYSVCGKKNNIIALMFFGVKVASVLAVLLVFCGFGMADYISQIFNIGEKNYFIIITYVVGVTLIVSIAIGALQGLKRFFDYGIQNLINVGCKLIFSIFLVYAGLKLYGVLIALLIGIILSGIYAYYKIIKLLGKPDKKSSIMLPYLEIVKYSIGTFVAQACITVMTNGDILLVKAFFSETETGIYSSAMVLGKIAMYIAGAVVAALFPMVAEAYAKKQDTRNLLLKALLYGGGSSIICSLGLVFLGHFFISILFGERYIQAFQYLPYVCLFIVPLTFLTVIMNFVLAIGKVSFFSISVLISCILAVTLITYEHSSVEMMLVVIGVVLFITAAVNIAVAYKQCNDCKC